MFKNNYFRLGLITAITTLAFLAVIPRIPIKFAYGPVNIDSFIGGYVWTRGEDTILDLTEFKRGLDIQGGIRIVLDANMSEINEEDREDALASSKEIISRRVNFLGVSEPNIQSVQSGDSYRIIVEIPGVNDTESAVNLIGQTAQLVFRELDPEVEYFEEDYQTYLFQPDSWVDTDLTGSDLNGADVVFPQAGAGVPGSALPTIQLRFSDEGRDKFSEIAKRNVGKPVGLYLDDSPFPISAPVVDQDLANGLFNDPIISGNFDIDGAQALSLQIRAGALPVPVEILEQQTVGATLGTTSVNKSFFAGALGLFGILVFLAFSYKKFGLIADLALIIYTILVLAIFKIVPVVITLPGIAGFILSVGVASDANVLIFERYKEERHWGVPKNLAMKYAFDRAWSSIKDSSTASLLIAGILFYFGTGPVRGFALTLAIGILTSLFTAVFVTKTLIETFKVGTK